LCGFYINLKQNVMLNYDVKDVKLFEVEQLKEGANLEV
jgi:hypothetical protein